MPFVLTCGPCEVGREHLNSLGEENQIWGEQSEQMEVAHKGCFQMEVFFFHFFRGSVSTNCQL